MALPQPIELSPVAGPAPCCAPLAAAPLDAGAAERLAGRFRALADPARLQLLSLVMASGSACICDLTEPVGLSQPTVSHHMKVLVEAGLLRRDKRGKWVHFSADPDAIRDLVGMLIEPGRGIPVRPAGSGRD